MVSSRSSSAYPPQQRLPRRQIVRLHLPHRRLMLPFLTEDVLQLVSLQLRDARQVDAKRLGLTETVRSPNRLVEPDEAVAGDNGDTVATDNHDVIGNFDAADHSRVVD